MILDVRRLRVLREVALRGTLAAAAEALAFTPSAISQQLSTLEREVGAELLERTGRSVRLTDAGQLLVEHAALVLADLERAEAALEASLSAVSGTVRLSAFPSVTTAVIGPAVAALARTHPDVTVEVIEGDGDRALRSLGLGEIDLVVAHEYSHAVRPPDPSLDRRELFAEALSVVVPPGRLPAGVPVALESLAGETWAMAPEWSDCGAATREACRGAGFEPRVRYAFNEFGVVLGLVASGLAVSLLPDLAFASDPGPYDIHPVKGRSFERRVFVASRPGSRRRPVLMAVLDALDTAAEAHRRAAPASGRRR
jgi:DNA-binding transcriptional LysR family regulator